MPITWSELRKQLVAPEDEPRIAAIRAQMEEEIRVYRLARPDEDETEAEQ